MTSRVAGFIASVAAAFCPGGPRRQGSLASTANGVLPRHAPQTCVTVPTQPSAAYETGYIQCSSEPDSSVRLRMSERGEVKYVDLRVTRAVAESIASDLTREYGAPEDFGCATKEWTTPTFYVTVSTSPADSVAMVFYSTNRRGLAIFCP